MEYYEATKNQTALNMAETTLQQLYKGGIFDHIGFGFSRYSTDPYFLVPHFEKMLYDNVLLLSAYTKAYTITNNPLYREVAKSITVYLNREMKHPDGGFYSAQDADSDGIEGKYYVFDHNEIIHILGKEKGTQFIKEYNITERGNFEGKNIPNLLHKTKLISDKVPFEETLYSYRKSRTKLHLDDKILTAWNALAIASLSYFYRATGEQEHRNAAEKVYHFLKEHLYSDNKLSVSFRDGRATGNGFLDDYAFLIFALLNLYEATLDSTYLEEASLLCDKVITNFYDREEHGFFLYGSEHETLIIKPKETYDGAIPSGNSVMAYNLVMLAKHTDLTNFKQKAEEQLAFLSSDANRYPAGHSFLLYALLRYLEQPIHITIVLKNKADLDGLSQRIPYNAAIKIEREPRKQYPLLNDKTTFYVCKDYVCQPPTNQI